jgi:hypothetical protein
LPNHLGKVIFFQYFLGDFFLFVFGKVMGTITSGINSRIASKGIPLKVLNSDDKRIGNIGYWIKVLFAYCLGPVKSRSGRVESAAAGGARPNCAHPERGQ